MRRAGYALLLFVVLAGTVSPAFIRAVPVAAQTATTATTTDTLNLRSRADLASDVLTVMPKGATVTLTGAESNGFRPVSYNGIAGWAFSTFLAIDTPPAAPRTPATTTDAVNLRSGPGTSYRVLAVMPSGVSVTVTGAATSGFFPITYNGYTGWASGDFLRLGSEPAPVPPPPPASVPTGTAVTTAALNLRSGAGTSFGVLAIMPGGTRVVLTGQTANGFHSVSYNGRGGWASSEFLAVDGTVPAPTGTATATDNVNLRSGPATSYRALTVIPRGSRVTLTGQVNNGFHSVSYNGFTGWAFSTYLDLSSAPPPPPPSASVIPFAVTNAIVGPIRGTPDEVIAFARQSGAIRMDEVDRYVREIYRLAPEIGFDPGILVAQSALETGYWRSSWWQYRLNPAGLGITGDPRQGEASQTFASGTMAARGQIAHMHAEVFGASRALPDILQGADATYQLVFEAGWAGTIVTIDDLTGTWAVDPEYAGKIVRVGREIFA